MKLFISKTLFVGIIAFAFLVAFKLILPENKNYNSAFVNKLDILISHTQERKIVLIGGSSVGHGISAEQIQNATHLTTINLGHHAGFGLVDFRDLVLSTINKDDIIVFAPEWEFYANPTCFDTATLEDLYNNSHYLELTKNPNYKSFKSLILKKTGIINSLIPNHSPCRYDCYNNNGDIISTCGAKPLSITDYSVCFDYFNYELFSNTFPFINRPNTLIVFPPTQKRVYSRCRKQFDFLETQLFKTKLLILDSASANVYDESCFFDDAYHLSCENRILRTNKIIPKLIELMKISN